MSLTDGVSRERERQGTSECPLLMVCLEKERQGTCRMSLTDGLSREGETGKCQNIPY